MKIKKPLENLYKRLVPTLLSSKLVSVKPLSKPSGKRYYMNPKYHTNSETWMISMVDINTQSNTQSMINALNGLDKKCMRSSDGIVIFDPIKKQYKVYKERFGLRGSSLDKKINKLIKEYLNHSLPFGWIKIKYNEKGF